MRFEVFSTTAVLTVVSTLALVVALQVPVAARPDLLLRYQSDPMRKAGIDGCATCHVRPEGGGARNDFGSAFDAANHEITPLLRAAFPSHFEFPAVTLGDNTVFSFSDPKHAVVVVKRGEERAAVAVADLLTPRGAPVTAPASRMSFFVTSQGVPNGGQLGGIAGADRQCQTLAAAAGAGDRTWRAYLSTSFKGAPAANAGDRIGAGPWYNARGVVVARGVLDLHAREQLATHLLLTETGAPIEAGTTVLTGTLSTGLAAPDRSCANWTSTAGEAMAGAVAGSWNAAETVSCAPAATAPRLYCFATN